MPSNHDTGFPWLQHTSEPEVGLRPVLCECVVDDTATKEILRLHGLLLEITEPQAPVEDKYAARQLLPALRWVGAAALPQPAAQDVAPALQPMAKAANACRIFTEKSIAPENDTRVEWPYGAATVIQGVPLAKGVLVRNKMATIKVVKKPSDITKDECVGIKQKCFFRGTMAEADPLG